MDELSVRKDRATITAVLPDGTKIRGEVFLASYSDTHYGHQKVADILEGEKLFIPVSIKEEGRKEEGRVEFINKDQVMILEGELSSEEAEEKLAIGLYNIEKIKVLFINGEIIEGAMISEVPKERSRLSDCLNLPDTFISMIKGGRYFYLNKGMITKVESRAEEKPAEENPPEEIKEEEAPDTGIPDDTLLA